MAQGFGKLEPNRNKKSRHSPVKLSQNQPTFLASAMKAYQSGNLSQAKQLCQQILAEESNYADAWLLLGNIDREQGSISEAIAAYEQLLILQPQNVTLLSNLGVLYIQQQKPEAAITAFTKAIELSPNYAEAYSNLGQLYQDLGKSEEAVPYFQKAIELKPNYATAHYNLGNAYKHQNSLSSAIAHFRQAVELDPSYAGAYNNLGNTYLELGEFSLALQNYQQALQLQPNYGDAYVNLDNVYLNRGDLSQAIQLYQQAAQHKCKDAIGEHNLLFALHYSSQFPPQQIYTQHQNWGKKYQSLLSQEITTYSNSVAPQRKLKIGYVSADFKRHSVSYFFEPLLINCDRANFEITCYANNQESDKITKRLRQLSDNWREIYHLNDTEVTQLIRQDKIDILVDLAGHTLGNRLLVFARKPAPIQITYLGYPDTTGLTAMDYRFTDIYADPQGKTEHLHTETLVRFPQSFLCYQPPANAPDIAPIPAIANGYITFGSFNTLAKISPETISYWVAILKQVPDSRLRLKAKSLVDSQARERIYNLFAQEGIDRARLQLMGWAKGIDNHLALYNQIDIALDTYPYHGTTTTCEALWMGVPVITLAGKTHVSRVGVSLLSSVGLTEFIAESPEEYIEKTVYLANNKSEVAKLSQNLRSQMAASPLMDGKALSKSTESAYRQMWQNWCRSRGGGQAVEGKEQMKLAYEYFQGGKLTEAIACLKSIQKIQPDCIDAWHLLSNIYRQQGKLDLAITAYQNIIALQPSNASLLSNLGVLYIQQKETDKAIAFFKQAITIQPDYAEAYSNLGELYRELKLFALAAEYLQQAIKLKPNYSEAYNNLASVYKAQEKIELAIKTYQQAIALNPDYTNAYNNLGNVYQQQGNLAQACDCYHQALKLQPDYALVHFNLGNAYKQQGKLTLALQALHKAIEYKPDYSHAYNNLGNIYRDCGEIDKALQCLHQGHQLDDHHPCIYPNLLYYYHYISQYSPEHIYQQHRDWAKQQQNLLAEDRQPHINQRNPDKKIRLGYISGDLRTHSVAYFLEPILSNHNRDRFSIHCYANNPYNDNTSERLKKLVDSWYDIKKLDRQQVVDLIREDEIDILVDLSGHTGGNRFSVLASQPAPIQVSYLGYPDTTGLDTVQYRFTDAFADPIGTTEKFHSEQLIRLPHSFLCYQPPKIIVEVNSLPFLEKGYITFGSFNNLAKISTETISCWAKILQAVPNSRLVLKTKPLQEKDICDRIYNLFEQKGIDSDRLTLLGWANSIQDHLNLYHNIDIALDTYPYHGTTTTCEAMWMSVPVITLAGKTHVSRVGVSLLSTVGLSELITNSAEEYITKAVNLASHPQQLADLRQQLRQKLQTSPLMNRDLITRSIEKTYQDIWQAWCLDTKYFQPIQSATIKTPEIAPTKPDCNFTIFTIHHLSATGGTLISKCLAAMPNVVLLSEINPGVRVSGFNPFDPIQQFAQYSLLSPEELRTIFLERIALIVEKCQQYQQHLIIRDHSHSDFLLNHPVSQGSLISSLGDRYNLKPLVTLRNPIDSWLAMIPKGWHRHIGNFDNYCDRYLKFLDAYQDSPKYLYEDFVLQPDSILQQMCKYYDINFDRTYQARFSQIRLSGDSGRTSATIAPRPRRKYPQSFIEEVRQSTNFNQICQRNGYSGLNS